MSIRARRPGLCDPQCVNCCFSTFDEPMTKDCEKCGPRLRDIERQKKIADKQTAEIVEKGKTVTFENKTDTAFDVSVGIVFHKSGLYRISITDEKVSVEVEQERTAGPKRGKWERWVANEDQTNSLWRCTSCGRVVADRKYFLWKYCPNCGARMETDHGPD